MEITVLVEKVEGNGYRATAGMPFSLTAEGATQEEALKKFREAVSARLASGARIVSVSVGQAKHPWAEFAGTWTPGDPVIEEWKQLVEEYRRQVDEDPNAL